MQKDLLAPCYVLRPDIFHRVGVEGYDLSRSTVGDDRDAQAVFSLGIHARQDRGLIVGKYFHDAAIHKETQCHDVVFGQYELRGHKAKMQTLKYWEQGSEKCPNETLTPGITSHVAGTLSDCMNLLCGGLD